MTVFFIGKSNEEIKVDLSTTPRNATSGAGGLDDQVYQRLLKERIIFLGSVVEDSMANAICAQMLLLAAEDPEKDIYLYITTWRMYIYFRFNSFQMKSISHQQNLLIPSLNYKPIFII